MVPGGTATVGVSGGTDPITMQTSFEGALVRYDGVNRTLFITGRANGRGTVTLSDAVGNSATVNVLVAPPAGVVPTDTTIELAGNVSQQFAAARIQAAIGQSAQLQPGASVTISVGTVGPLQPGDAHDAQAAVRINGNDTYVDQNGTTNVHLRVDALPPLEPTVLFYSDDPERLGPADDGVLFRGTIDATRPARAYAYHVSDVPGRRLFLALQAASSPARIQVLGAVAGPSDAFSYVGHLATVRYLGERSTQESFVIPLAPGAPYLLPLGSNMLAGQLVDAIYDLRILDGGAVNVAVVAASGGTDPMTLVAQPERPGDGHDRRGEFSIANVPPLTLAFTAGAPEPAPFSIGTRLIGGAQVAAFPNLRAGGSGLAGDYGVLRSLSLQLANPTSAAQTVFLYEQPAGGGVTTTMWFAGESAPTEVRCVSDSSTRYLVKSFALAPGETRTVTGTYMTDGTSFFPLWFGLTATPPAPVPQNGCGGGAR